MDTITMIAIILASISVIGIVSLLVYLKILRSRYSKNSALYTKDKLIVKEKTNVKDSFDRIHQLVYFLT